MKVKVVKYNESRHDLICEFNENYITVDPFVSCAVDTGGNKDYKAIGFSMVGKEYNMDDYCVSKFDGSYLPNIFEEIK